MNDPQPSVSTATIDDALSIAGQLQADDMRKLADAGFRSVINNRPDFEGGSGQPAHADIEAAARAAGLEYRYLPVPPGGHTVDQARAMIELVDTLPKPVLAFCRSGRRSAALYMMGRSLG
jgi:uncharacterized protein (TIGR01244 family)